jgi:hypothetical protein
MKRVKDKHSYWSKFSEFSRPGAEISWVFNKWKLNIDLE